MKGSLLFILGVAAVAALPSTPQREYSRIVGGSVTTINQYPFGVSMLASGTGSVFSQVCGGTILNNRSVLSAAHCVQSWNQAWQWRSRVGSTFANSGGAVFNTAQIIRHPQYNPRTEDNDIVVLRISGVFSWSNTVAAVRLAGANYNVADNQPVWAIGWGRTAVNGPASEQLRHVQVWTVNQNVCVQRYATIGLRVNPNMLCSGWLDVGGRDQCQGDSGGPLLHNGVQVGVCSWGYRCAEPFFPGVNARVSTFSNWIVSNA